MIQNPDPYILIFSLFMGIALSVLYYGGLWLTVKKVVIHRKSGLIFVLSFIIRIILVCIGFYFVIKKGLVPASVCFIAFLVTRKLLINYTHTEKGKEY